MYTCLPGKKCLSKEISFFTLDISYNIGRCLQHLKVTGISYCMKIYENMNMKIYTISWRAVGFIVHGFRTPCRAFFQVTGEKNENSFIQSAVKETVLSP